MKKLLGILLSISLLACTLCSCSSKKDNAKTEANTTTTNQAQTVNSDGETTTDAATTATTTTASVTAKPTTTSQEKTTTKKSSENKTATKTTARSVKTTTTKSNQRTPYSASFEVSPSSVTARAGKVLRAWKISSDTTSVELHKVAYGPVETQTFMQKYDRAMDITSKTVSFQPIINVAIVTCSPTTLKFGGAKQLLDSSMGSAESMARKAGALVAVNGQAIEGQNIMTVRNGKLYNSDAAEGHILRMYKDGKWELGPINNSNKNQIVSDGVYNTFRFQYSPLIWDGVKNHYDDPYYNNHTMLAKISENKYILAVSEFMSLNGIVDVLSAYGAKNAVVLNGGNCSIMYVRGIGNVTGTNATQLKELDKVNTVETEFFADHGMLGLNSAGKQKLGGPCFDAIDIVYAK